MDLVRRRAGWLLTVSLLALTGWTIVVSFLMPNWFDTSEDCAKTFEQPDSGGIEVATHWFPPTATCDFGSGDVRDFISPTATILLTIAMVLIAAATGVGLYFTARRFFEPEGAVHPADGVDLKARRMAQLASGTVLFVLAIGVYTGVSVFAIILGGAVGGIIFGFVGLIMVAGFGAGLDRHVGPLPSTAVASRRRGAAAGLIAFGADIFATAVTGRMPFFRIWAAPLGAVVYVVVVLVQWSRLRRTDGRSGVGDTVEQDLLDDPRS
jgi:hypothetical protein